MTTKRTKDSSQTKPAVKKGTTAVKSASKTTKKAVSTVKMAPKTTAAVKKSVPKQSVKTSVV
ncbi:MAG: hypothetical protein NC133_04055, partial [Prevotella sp.]|nr:hypothetical protein [Prevotella sp.]